MNTDTNPMVITATLDANINAVWQAITQLKEMKIWYFPQLTAFEPKIGFKTKFTVNVADRTFIHLWHITNVSPLQTITYEWQFEGYSGKGLSTFELSEDGPKTEIKLTFTTLEAFPDHIPEFKRESGLAGWQYLINEKLVEYFKN